MDKVENNTFCQHVSANLSGVKQSLRWVQVESEFRKIRANGWAREQDDRVIAEEALQAVLDAFPDMSSSEAATAVKRLLQT